MKTALPGSRGRAGLTLIELLLASLAGAIILSAVMGVYARAVHVRNSAIERMAEARGQARALTFLRHDLRGARLSGGQLASVLIGSTAATRGSFTKS